MAQPFRREQAHRHSDGFFDDRSRKRSIHVRERREARFQVDSELDAMADTQSVRWCDDGSDDSWMYDDGVCTGLMPERERPPAPAPLYVPLAEVAKVEVPG